MDGDEIVHVISLGKFENDKKYKEQILQEIIAAICAMLNSKGGKVVINIDIDQHFDNKDNNTPVEDSRFSQTSLVIRILEQSVISIIGLTQCVSKIVCKEDGGRIIISVKQADSLITTNYNLYLPSESQVTLVSPPEPLEKVKDDIISRKVVPEPVQPGLHCKRFVNGMKCDFHETRCIQIKCLKSGRSKRTTLADRMTGKGNKFSCYVSAFANYNGGNIYYGITDDGVVDGELIPIGSDKSDIVKKVEKAINKMIWPEQIGQPKRGEHWEIFFEPVVDENSKPIPSTFVIVIYIAPCLGGVFTEEPECYEMVERKVKKMSFTTWKKRILQPLWLRSVKEIHRSVKRITWSSAEARRAFTVDSDDLRKLVSDGQWDTFPNECASLESKSELSETMKLLVLSKRITARYRKGDFNKARELLEQYNKIAPQVQDYLIFEVIGLYLHAGLKRASGDFKALGGLLTTALSKAEQIEPGLVTATVYVFAGTVADLINSKDPSNKIDSPEVLSIRALEHLQCVPDSSDVLADMKRKAHITLATFYLGCNISGQRIKDSIDNSSLEKANTSIKAIHQSAYEEHPVSRYHEVQLNLVLSIFHYRSSQLNPDQRVRFLRNASRYANKAKCLAKDFRFEEMVHWSKANEDLCTDELVRETDSTQPSFHERRAQRENHDATRQSDRMQDRNNWCERVDRCDRTERRERVDRQDRTEQHLRNRTEQDERTDRVEPSKNPRDTELQKVGIGHVDMSNIAGVIDIDDIAKPASKFEPASPHSDFVEVKSKRTQKEQRERAREEEERKRRETENMMQDAMLKPETNKSTSQNKQHSTSKPPRFARNTGVPSSVVSTLPEGNTPPSGGISVSSHDNNTINALASANVEQKRDYPLMLVKPSSPPPPPTVNAWAKPLSITPAKPPNEASAESRIIQPDPLIVASVSHQPTVNNDLKMDFEMQEKMEAAKKAWDHSVLSSASIQTFQWKASVTNDENTETAEVSVVNQIPTPLVLEGQERQYTPPGQSEMSKHVHAKPFQPSESSTHQTAPNVHQVPTVSKQRNARPVFHANNAVLSMQAPNVRALQGSVSFGDKTGISPTGIQAHPLPASHWNYPYPCRSMQQLPPATYPARIMYRTTDPSYPTTTSVVNQHGVLVHQLLPMMGQLGTAVHPMPGRRAFNLAGSAQPRMPPYQLPTLPRFQQPTQPQQQQQQQQQMFRNQQHQPMSHNWQQRQQRFSR